MDSRRVTPTIGIVASILVVVLLGLPYAIVDAASVSSYYGAGVLSPWGSGLVSILAIIAFAAGRQGRTDPETAAGGGLVFGLFALLVVLLWAATVPAEVPLNLTANEPWLGSVSTGTVLEYHRWVLSGVAAIPFLAGIWYARVLRVL